MSKPGSSRGWVSVVCIISVLAVAALALTVLGPQKYPASATSSKAGTFASQRQDIPADMQPGIHSASGTLPLVFEQNKGQVDAAVSYLARTSGYTLFLTGNEAVFSLRSSSPSGPTSSDPVNRARTPQFEITQLRTSSPNARPSRNETTATVRMQLVGSNRLPKIAASEQLPGRANYFIGKDPAKWRSNVPLFARVSYQDVYPGVKLAFHGAQGQMEFDFIVAPGANPRPIDLQFNGAKSIQTDGSGDLVISSAAGDVLLHKPIAYQEQHGSAQPVSARFVLGADDRVGFELGAYDHNRELVIDPSVSYAYSTYLGGSLEDDGYGIAVDASGNAYVTGRTSSADFPIVTGGYQTNNKGGGGTFDVFVSKIAADGSSLIYSTYVGGSGNDSGNAIAVDASGDAFVTGGTASGDFPVTAGVFQPTLGTSATDNAFIFELNASGTSLTYSTYLGGTASDEALGLAVDGSGNVYVAGKTTSADFPVFPVATPLQAYVSGSLSSGFVSELNSTATALIFSTYIGGGTGDTADAIALDSADNVYVAGETFSSNFHVTTGAFQATCGSCANSFPDAFVTAIKAGGTGYVYSTFLGGSAQDGASAIAVDAGGNAYVTGSTQSSDFPVKGAIQETSGGGTDAFVTKLNPTGSALIYSTYLGGAGFDLGAGIAVDGAGNAYVTGQTNSDPFPTANATQTTYGGSNDAFVTEINPPGSKLVFSTYLGGPAAEDASGLYGAIALDSVGANIYVTGDTASASGFPLQAALQSTYGGDPYDAFVVKYAQPTFGIKASTPVAVNAGSSATSTVTLTSYNGYSSPVNLSCTVTGTGSPLPACGVTAFSTNPVTPTSGGAATTLTITTTGPSGVLPRPRTFYYALWLPIFGLCAMGLVLSFSGSRNKALLGFLMIGIAGLLLLPACGSSSKSTGGSCASAPNAPTGLAASGTTTTGTTLNWTAATVGASCSITGYTVYQNGKSIGTPTSTTLAVTGLTPATQYSFTVAASDSAGISAQSTAVSVTTLSGATPAGTYSITITGTGTDANATTQSFTIPLTVN